MRNRATRLSQAIVRLYPRGWRERYGAELLALIEDTGSTWTRAVDLTYGCADAWLRATPAGPVIGAIMWATLGAFLVRVITNTAMSFSPIPPELEFWRDISLLAFSLVFALIGARVVWIFLKVLLNELKGLKSDVGLSAREVRTLSAVILIIGVRADFTQLAGPFDDMLRSPVVPMATFTVLLQLRTASTSYRRSVRLYREARQQRRMKRS